MSYVDRLKVILVDLADIQQGHCAYGSRFGEPTTCDCKYPIPGRPWTSEMTGCPELRDACRALSGAIAELEARV